MRIASLGHAVFAATFITLGILGLVRGDLPPVWAPLPRWVPAREIFVYLCALVSLTGGIGLLWPRTAAVAARVLSGYLLLWWLLFRVPYLFIMPKVEDSWSGSGETAVMVAGAWVLYAWFAPDWDRQRLGFATGDPGVRSARVLYGLALLPFGLAHFIYLRVTAGLVPAWLPWHVGWACFTGGAFIAAGLAVLCGVWAGLAATLSVVQMALFVPLVWGPILLAGHLRGYEWSETILTAALAAGGWVVADSYRGIRWPAAPRALG
jgi:uncharacterized membrane protein